MKHFKSIKNLISRVWRDESGQGTAEYVLILVAIVAVAGIFGGQIKEMFTKKLGQIKSSVVGFSQ